MKKIVVACVGDTLSLEAIAELSRHAEVVAVALDFGGGMPLPLIRGAALSAGAARCHALDVREAFARDYVLPALHARAFSDATAAAAALVPLFAQQQLQHIAGIERAEVHPPRIVLEPRQVAVSPPPRTLRIEFEDGVPIAVNGVTMTLPELLESLETITGEPAIAVLDRAIARAEDQHVA